jgi:D-sedoheptulose 7-phosphate isomerase
MTNPISSGIAASIRVKEALLADADALLRIQQVAEACTLAFRQGGKVLFCGNGGSAADAQHLAAELSGRFYYDRPPLYAEALHVNSSYLTAVGNDYGYDETYSRMVRAMGRPGDVLVAISTSGNSPNVVRAVEAANGLGMVTVGFTGAGGGQLATLCHHLLAMPSSDTPRIQEAHILVGHLICEWIEADMFPEKD